MIGVNHITIYSVFFISLYNLNVRFIPIFVKIILILYLLMFYRHLKKIKQRKRKNLNKKNHLLFKVLVRRDEGICLLQRISSLKQRKRFVVTKLKYVKIEAMGSPRQRPTSVVAKQKTCCSEKGDTSQDWLLVRLDSKSFALPEENFKILLVTKIVH